MSKTLDRRIGGDARFESYESIGADGYMLYSDTGWCMDDVGCHVYGCDTVREALAAISLVRPCDCEDCTKAAATGASIWGQT